MEYKEIIWYAIISMVCVVPVIFLIRSASAKTRLVKRSLKKQLKKLPEEYDIWSERGIAYDPLHKRLQYVSVNSEKETAVAIDLSDVMKCVVKANKRLVSEDQKSVDPKDIETIELCFEMSGAKKAEENLLFFKVDPDGPFQSNYYYQLARKWRKRVNEEVKSRAKAAI